MSIVTTRAKRRELERMNAKMPRELREVPREPVVFAWRNTASAKGAV